MNNTFLRQLRGFFIATLKVQLRNPVILLLGFLLPIMIVLGYSYIVTNNFSKTKVGYVSKETTHYKKAVEYLSNNNRTYEVKEFATEEALTIGLQNDQVDVKLWYANVPNKSLEIISKDSNNLKNKLIEIVLTNEINSQFIDKEISTEKVDSKTKVNARLYNTQIGDLLQPLLPVLLSLAILICCVSMSDLNIFNKKENIALRRIFAAPSMPNAYLLGQSFSRVLFCLIQIMFMFIVMIVFFRYNPPSFFALMQMFLLVIALVCIFIQQNITLSAIFSKGKTLIAINSLILGSQFLLITGLLPIRSDNVYTAFLLEYLPLGAFTKLINVINTGGVPLISITVLLPLTVLFAWFCLLAIIANKAYKMNRN
ncbi:MAG: ABC transporter permease [Patescibacteria group bacterium]